MDMKKLLCLMSALILLCGCHENFNRNKDIYVQEPYYWAGELLCVSKNVNGNSLYGLARKDGRVVVPIKYDNIDAMVTPAGKVYYTGTVMYADKVFKHGYNYEYHEYFSYNEEGDLLCESCHYEPVFSPDLSHATVYDKYENSEVLNLKRNRRVKEVDKAIYFDTYYIAFQDNGKMFMDPALMNYNDEYIVEFGVYSGFSSEGCYRTRGAIADLAPRPMQDGYLLVESHDNKYGVIDSNAKLCIPCEYYEIGPVVDGERYVKGLFVCRPTKEKTAFGIVDAEGNVLTEFKYYDFSITDEGVFAWEYRKENAPELIISFNR